MDLIPGKIRVCGSQDLQKPFDLWGALRDGEAAVRRMDCTVRGVDSH